MLWLPPTWSQVQISVAKIRGDCWWVVTRKPKWVRGPLGLPSCQSLLGDHSQTRSSGKHPPVLGGLPRCTYKTPVLLLEKLRVTSCHRLNQSHRGRVFWRIVHEGIPKSGWQFLFSCLSHFLPPPFPLESLTHTLVSLLILLLTLKMFNYYM